MELRESFPRTEDCFEVPHLLIINSVKDFSQFPKFATKPAWFCSDFAWIFLSWRIHMLFSFWNLIWRSKLSTRPIWWSPVLFTNNKSTTNCPKIYKTLLNSQPQPFTINSTNFQPSYLFAKKLSFKINAPLILFTKRHDLTSFCFPSNAFSFRCGIEFLESFFIEIFSLFWLLIVN